MPIFLKIDGIEGESNDKVHPGELDILSFSWGVHNSSHASGGGAGAGKSAAEDFSFAHAIDKASPKLMLACCLGTHIPSAMLTVRKAGGQSPIEYMKIKLTDCIVSSYQNTGSGEERAIDSFSLNFVKIDFAETQQAPDGGPGQVTETFFDFQANKGGVISEGGRT